MGKSETTFNLNVEIKNLPIGTNRIIDTIARLRGMTKRDVIRLALVEFAEHHKKDLFSLLRDGGI